LIFNDSVAFDGLAPDLGGFAARQTLGLKLHEGPDIRVVLLAPTPLAKPELQLQHGDSPHSRILVLVSPGRDESMTEAWQGHEIPGQN
jgi:hypothetical protein